MDSLNNVLQSVREDDFVEYYLFPQVNTSDEKQQEIILGNILSKTNAVVEKYTKEYLWHKDEFQLVARTSLSNFLTHIDGKEENLPPHLYGVSHYGENIEDEWFMVFLLREITKEVPGLIARVYDSDGEFLLIEAAEFLPHWANPDICENRVYIYDGNVHLLPPEDTENPEITVQTALQQIWSHPNETLANVDVQNSIKNKLSLYPENITNNLHHATVYVPTAVASILKERPNLVSPAVQAFCNRDTVDLRACRAMKYFPPEQRVKARIKFTRCLYAMLLHSKYMPDRKTGWNIPPKTSTEFKQHILGVKLACGFEILVAQAKPSQDIEADKGWTEYLKSLSDKGYFKGLLEGSKEYHTLLNKAKEYYINHRDTMQYSPLIGRQILDLLRNSEVNYALLKKEAENLPKDDDESWLDISPEELDKMLQERYGQKKILKVDDTTEAGNFAQKVNSFLNHISDVQGAEFPAESAKNGEDRPVRPPRGKKNSKKGVSFAKDTEQEEKPSQNHNRVSFDPDQFANALQSILNFVIPEDNSWDLESDSEMSEYENDEFVKDSEITGDVEGDKKNKMEKYMAEMDKELASTTIGQSFEKKNLKKEAKEFVDSTFEDIENFKPVDIDVNALKNILESYRSQLGEAGPSSTMLGPMGIHLDPKN